MKRKWKKILGGCILISPLVVLLGAMVWANGVVYMLVHLGLALAFIVAVLLWLVTVGLLLSGGELTVDDFRFW